MALCSAVVLYFLCCLLLVSCAASSSVRTRRRSTSADCSIECHIVWPEVLADEGEEEPKSDLSCIAELPGRSYRQTLAIDLPPTFLALHGHAIESGSLHLCITNGTVDNGTVLLADDSQLIIVEPSRRRLQVSKRGVKRLLAVRVTTPSGEEPDESVELIQGAIFGTGPRRVSPSVVSQYLDISHDQLKYVPAVGDNINNGVLEVEIKTRVIAGKNIQGYITDDLLNQTEEAIGPIGDAVDNIIFCLPTGSKFQKNEKWTAFTYLFEPYSYYQQSRCTRLSVAVHELGHSLGFQHSGVGDNIYADKTGYMGYAVNKVGHPRKAFNGHKHWLSGWFQDRTYSINPRTESAGIRLASFVDYGNRGLKDEDYVLVRAGNMFIQFNLAESYNEDADEPNTVTITEAVGNEEVSMRLAALQSGESYTANGDGSRSFIVEVCSIRSGQSSPNHAFISIHRDGERSLCSQEIGGTTTAEGGSPWQTVINLPPFSSPTPRPVVVPTRGPSTGISISPPTTVTVSSPITIDFPRPMVVPTVNTRTNMPSLAGRTVVTSRKTDENSNNKFTWKSQLVLIPVTVASGAFVCFGLVFCFFLHYFRPCGKGGSSTASNKTDKNSFTSGSENSRDGEHRDSSIEGSDESCESDNIDWWIPGGDCLADVGCVAR